jgi:two-component system heavy metal sensor histidine kinase CusS
MRWPRRDSLVDRLALSYAAIGAAVLCSMAIFVYAAMVSVVGDRHDAELDRVSRAVLHVVRETGRPDQLESMRHKLDDILVGQANLRVTIRRMVGDVLFESGAAPPEIGATLIERRLRAEPPAAELGSLDVRLALSTDADDRLLRSLAMFAAVAALLGTLLLSLAGARIAARGLRPVDALGAALARWRPGRPLDPQVHRMAQPIELHPLVERFETMLEEIRLAQEQLRSFNEDVAHELRTPLALLIGECELALSQRSVDGFVESTERQLEDLRRLSAIVADMLFLGRADRDAVAERATVASLEGLAREVAEYFEAAVLDRGLTLGISGDASAAVDPGLIKRALSNLLANAVRHAENGSRIAIEIERLDPSGEARIAVRNEGATIPAEHLPRLFDRFYRVSASREHSARHHGLGLAIVAAIARMHSGAPFATSQAGVTRIGFSVAAAPKLHESNEAPA